jgi:prevent-host-death family protein
MSLKDIRSVTATEFKTRFGEFRDAAQAEPIGIKNHGRVSAVLISGRDYEKFERLQQLDTRRALYAHELGEDVVKELEGAEMDPRHDHLNALLK